MSQLLLAVLLVLLAVGSTQAQVDPNRAKLFGFQSGSSSLFNGTFAGASSSGHVQV